jgi:hypothetical protein
MSLSPCGPADTYFGDAEPNVRAWGKYRTGDNCNWTTLELPYNHENQINLEIDSANGAGKVKRDDLQAIWVPPHMTARVCRKDNLGGVCSDLTGNGPELGWYPSLYNLPIGGNEIQSYVLSKRMSWDDFKRKCCMGEMNKDLCGMFSQSSQSCDNLMTQWCANNPGDPKCACFKGGSGTNSWCYDGDCLTKGYMTNNMRNFHCPDVKTLTCNQYFQLDPGAKNNVLKQIDMNQKCSIDSPPVGGTPTVSMSDSKTMHIDNSATTQQGLSSKFASLTTAQKILIFIIILAVIVGLFAYSSDSDYIDPYTPPQYYR